MADEEPGDDKKSSKVATIAIVAVLTLLAGGGGWFVGTLLAPPAPETAVAASQAADGGQGIDGQQQASDGMDGVLLLDPITSNLAYPSQNRVRLEVALIFKGVPDPELAREIHQDILAYMRTVSLQQMQGPRGFQYLREDLHERVDLRSQGRVTNIMFRTFVIE
ncbi:flagellar basal body-associated FliL family protein [Shinella daejeonensis]|uniref:flagellar basal body-associated FliL family protein n=1 Tax=Shinella daejeonensis TaxID=659017 RepID=UPI0020C7EB21|nr:flagellar basal body-associated FliL family protein [Shinella daejeonensis]MCP8896810.1 flagellar basal body-associated FliL family protein [Shinella daejeonensis]